MAQDSGLDIKITTDWQDITESAPALAGQYAWVCNQGWSPVLVAFSSSADAPTGGGYYLVAGETAQGTATHIWVRGVSGTADVSAGLGDVWSSGGVSTIAAPNGADVTQGAVADPAATNASGSWTVVSLLKGLFTQLAGVLKVQPTLGGAAVSSANPLAVSATALPLPTGAASGALQAVANGLLGQIQAQLPDALGPQASAGSLSVALASDLVVPISSAVTSFPPLVPGTTHDFTRYGVIRIQVTGLSGGDSISFGGAMAQTDTPQPLEVMSVSGSNPGTLSASITANGLYVIFGAGGLWITTTQTGTASTPTIIANANQ